MPNYISSLNLCVCIITADLFIFAHQFITHLHICTNFAEPECYTVVNFPLFLGFCYILYKQSIESIKIINAHSGFIMTVHKIITIQSISQV